MRLKPFFLQEPQLYLIPAYRSSVANWKIGIIPFFPNPIRWSRFRGRRWQIGYGISGPDNSPSTISHIPSSASRSEAHRAAGIWIPTPWNGVIPNPPEALTKMGGGRSEGANPRNPIRHSLCELRPVRYKRVISPVPRFQFATRTEYSGIYWGLVGD